MYQVSELNISEISIEDVKMLIVTYRLPLPSHYHRIINKQEHHSQFLEIKCLFLLKSSENADLFVIHKYRRTRKTYLSFDVYFQENKIPSL